MIVETTSWSEVGEGERDALLQRPAVADDAVIRNDTWAVVHSLVINVC
ncbi:MAG: hypothetical protein OEM50_09755 [Gammaproteobacteria bacterium]|nr:hypothetical protein [Gammaproteobacteria bacterium]